MGGVGIATIKRYVVLIENHLLSNHIFRFEDRTMLPTVQVQFFRFWEAKNVRRHGDSWESISCCLIPRFSVFLRLSSYVLQDSKDTLFQAFYSRTHERVSDRHSGVELLAVTGSIISLKNLYIPVMDVIPCHLMLVFVFSSSLSRA